MKRSPRLTPLPASTSSKSARRTDERLATLVFLAAWGFANEHYALTTHPPPARPWSVWHATGTVHSCESVWLVLPVSQLPVSAAYLSLPTAASPESPPDETAGGRDTSCRAAAPRHCRPELPLSFGLLEIRDGHGHERQQSRHSDSRVPRGSARAEKGKDFRRLSYDSVPNRRIVARQCAAASAVLPGPTPTPMPR